MTQGLLILFAIVMGVIITHWFADFVLQSDEDAKGKSTSWKHLLSHTIDYSAVWATISLGLVYFVNLPSIFLWFAPITFVLHTLTDYFTSRLNSKLWGAGRVHDFFVSIGFDQILHYAQLFGTILFLQWLWT